VLGILLFIPFVDFFALILSLVWIVVTGIALASSGESSARGVAAHPA
jgi:hypothetical protein